MGILEWLVDRGYSGIAFKLVYEHESQSGSMEDVERYDVVALKDNVTPKRFTWVTYSTRWKPMTYSVQNETDIDHVAYREALEALGGIRDRPSWYVKRVQEEERRTYIDKELAGLYPTCPDCEQQMVIRHRKRDHAPFFGCKSFPECTGTRSVDSTSLRRIMSLLDEKSRLTMR
ncbi:topoisomerase DNA-binding C4 zinc finger domain-containing protein [Patescibacteria group bacterium]|nr:topoisomerase DNA-binding C4 zinc finger domain-containing protein [Patescibacteria group bacterium]MBU1448664.1 topoisomerase DNA-binding C4 zinc finger domain-containing protein [Patescibacteria group bacterium]MBU2613309.1 topoisomerase DNA-binding C4 zinc finger domain-containing protein [Patescibacteria group bacterium]